MKTVKEALTHAQFYTDDKDYMLIQLHPRAITVAAGIIAEIGEPFGAIVVDKDEVTLLTYADALEEFKLRIPDATHNGIIYRLITFDVELDPNLIGFMAILSKTLAEAEISLLTYAAYSRDHILVPKDKIKNALSALEDLRI